MGSHSVAFDSRNWPLMNIGVLTGPMAAPEVRIPRTYRTRTHTAHRAHQHRDSEFAAPCRTCGTARRIEARRAVARSMVESNGNTNQEAKEKENERHRPCGGWIDPRSFLRLPGTLGLGHGPWALGKLEHLCGGTAHMSPLQRWRRVSLCVRVRPPNSVCGDRSGLKTQPDAMSVTPDQVLSFTEPTAGPSPPHARLPRSGCVAVVRVADGTVSAWGNGTNRCRLSVQVVGECVRDRLCVLPHQGCRQQQGDL